MSGDRERRVAEVLYDQLTGRHTGDRYGPNAVLAAISLPPRERWTKRDEETYSLMREADYLGCSVVPSIGDRWGLATRLAALVLAALDEPSAAAAPVGGRSQDDQERPA